jgi:DNA-binding beta-propeller fold protein YncE
MATCSKRVAVLCATAVLTGFTIGTYAADGGKLRVVSERTATGFTFPESVAYDPSAKVLYVSQFGGTELKPAEKDGNGKISKVSLDGKILEQRFLPPAGETMNKPKGIWVKGNRLWVTDIDAVWIFDIKTRKGKKLEIPGITFANDPAVQGNSLYVSDNRADRLYRIEPADFLSTKEPPQVSIVLAGKSIYPNGLYPAKQGSLLIVGFQSAKQPRGIHALDRSGEVKELAKPIGRLDGLYEMHDGSILMTDWDSGSLVRWTEKAGIEKLATGFKGPADFAVAPDRKGMTVFVPDLPGSQLRIVRLEI